jgi:TonB-dependent SusC/RagA subfamily outer membrane receptor
MTKKLKSICMLFLAIFAFTTQIYANGNNEQTTTVQQNTRTCKGAVTTTSGDPIIGASVKVVGTKNGTVTNIDGNFSLNDVPTGSSVEISYIGCKTQVLKFTGASLRVTLQEDNASLDEVVVVAYGTQKKKDLTGSMTAVDPGTLQVQNTTTVSRMLEGSAPGIQVSSLDGQPGYDMGIRLRGVSSTNGNGAAALVVIDGVVQQAANVTNVNAENPLSQLNPSDIASVSVLKDAASTALYGSRGANGVILITTKGGQSGKTRISFESRVGANIAGYYQQPNISSAATYYEYA